MPARTRGSDASTGMFRVDAVAVGPPGRLVSSTLVPCGDGGVLLEAYTPEGRRSLMRADPDGVSLIAGFRSGSSGVRTGASLADGRVLLFGDGGAYRVDLGDAYAARVAISRLPRNVSHVYPVDRDRALVAPLFADVVAMVSISEEQVVRQVRSPAHEATRRDGDDIWLINGSRGSAGRYVLDDLKLVTTTEIPRGATPVVCDREVLSLPGEPFQTGGINRASFVQVQPDGRVQASEIDGSNRREGPSVRGLDRLVGVDGHGRLVGLAGSAVVLIDRETLAQTDRLALVVRRLLAAVMTGPTSLALLQPLPPLVHFVSW